MEVSISVNEQPVGLSMTVLVAAESSNAQSGRTTGAGPSVQEQARVPLAVPSTLFDVSPSKIRVDSLVMAARCCSTWLLYALFVVMLLVKLESKTSFPWWATFWPLWLSHLLVAVIEVNLIAKVDHYIRKQLGPPPPEGIPAGLHLQFDLVRRIRRRSHIVDAVCGLVESASALSAEIWLVYELQKQEDDSEYAMQPIRFILTPLWIGWMVAILCLLLKDRTERVVGTLRDLLMLFLMLVAFKLDGRTTYPWTIIFIIPWAAFACAFMTAVMVGMLLVVACFWRQPRVFLMPLGFLGVLVSLMPQLPGCIFLVRLMQGGAGGPPLAQALLPFAGSLLGMTAGSLVLSYGLYHKEQERDAILQSGLLWASQERLWNQLRGRAVEAVQRKVDHMSEADISRMVAEMMSGKPRPAQLLRVGETLFRRVSVHPQPAQAASSVPAAAAAAEPPRQQQEAVAPGAAADIEAGAAAHRRASSSGSDVDARGLPVCCICYDKPGAFVFLDCGHGGFCRRCAHLMFVRPPNECPTCRQKVDQVVELEAMAGIGDLVSVLVPSPAASASQPHRSSRFAWSLRSGAAPATPR